MALPHRRTALCVLVVVAACSSNHAAPPPLVDDPNTTVLIGTTAAGEAIVTALKLPGGPDTFLRWRLALHRDSQTRSPAGYELRCETIVSVPNTRGRREQTMERTGTWALDRGRPADREATIVTLDNGVCLVQLDENVFHLLKDDRSLMVGSGGWGYTLNRESVAEPLLQESEVVFPASDSYKLTPLASGPTVFGIYVGRTPIKGIWRELERPSPLDAMKAKWRLTLFQDPQTGAPTKYRIDGTLYREGLMKSPQEPREGDWKISEHPTTKAVVFELGPWKSEPGIRLLCGDENVLFFLDRQDKLMVGSTDFGYTLNRREETQTPATK